MRGTLLIVGVTLSLSATAFAQTLAETAKKAEAQRQAAAAKPAAEKKADPKKAEPAADAPPKKVYTNKDLKETSPSPLKDDPAAGALLKDGSQTPLLPSSGGVVKIVDMHADAQRYFAPALNQMRARIVSWISQVEVVQSHCDNESYRGLNRAYVEQHRTYCRAQLSEMKLRKQRIESLKAAMEEAAHKKGIYPGVMRDLFTEIGWTP